MKIFQIEVPLFDLGVSWRKFTYAIILLPEEYIVEQSKISILK